jgi:hypothetical protein
MSIQDGYHAPRASVLRLRDAAVVAATRAARRRSTGREQAVAYCALQGWVVSTSSCVPSFHQNAIRVVQWPEAGQVGGVVA